ncbi:MULTISPECIES: metallophosphoesterase [unclassified Actinomyces]|uniref:metallophosphoesterase n=1 Tax=unclassified Actinomyces TaxID=2609248 RepID=UPI0020179F51|nr:MULTISPECIES: metallophosphoesterase [unclassified Actinomyces]
MCVRGAGTASGAAARRAALTARAVTVVGAGVLGYALLEARMPVLRRLAVPVLAPGEEPLTLLHLADLHLTDRTEARVAWVRSLSRLHPDVVVNTGDNLSFASGLEPLSRALEPFLHLPGAFVMGDHDYRTTIFSLPTRYLRRDPRDADDPQREAAALPWREVRDLQRSGGWVDLTNTRGELCVRGRRVRLVGVDDPHADRDVYPERAVASESEGTWVRGREGAALHLGLVHAPYRRVLAAMSADDVDLALAGHTHGGQLCLPGYGALVTNCDLDRERVTRRLSQYPGRIGEPQAADHMYLHVSAGLGTSPFTPVRLACRPEATLLTLLPAA